MRSFSTFVPLDQSWLVMTESSIGIMSV